MSMSTNDLMGKYDEFVDKAWNGESKSVFLWGGPGEKAAQIVFNKAVDRTFVTLNLLYAPVMEGRLQELQRAQDVTEMFASAKRNGYDIVEKLNAISGDRHEEYHHIKYRKGVSEGRLREMPSDIGNKPLDHGMFKKGEMQSLHAPYARKGIHHKT